METFPALPALCEGSPPVTSGFSSQRPVTRSFDVFFDVCLKTAEKTIGMLVVWDAVALVLTSLELCLQAITYLQFHTLPSISCRDFGMWQSKISEGKLSNTSYVSSEIDLNCLPYVMTNALQWRHMRIMRSQISDISIIWTILWPGKKETSKIRITGPLWGESPDGRQIPLTKGK